MPRLISVSARHMPFSLFVSITSHNELKFSNRQALANSADLNQIDPTKAT